MLSLSPRKIRSAVVLIFVIVLHLVLDILYRPLAYGRSFQDLGFKDSFTQITSVIGISLLMILLEKENAWNGRMGKLFLIVIPVISMIVYEYFQQFIAGSKFDLQDILYTLIGGGFIWFIQFKIVK